ncbi:MAG: 3'-5' exonuclease [Ruoffia tabacinasalis]|uniref:3'-5' exonuclease n=1 Tax=Ruoffia sp. FAM 20858 TaxID=3259516 RepID=UPI0038889FAA
MEYVAFDFETANGQRWSACSLGAVKVVDGIMVKHFYELIDPLTSFAPNNIRIHGITPEQVQGKPAYDEVIGRFQEFVGEAPVVSHTQFDRGVIRAANEKFRLSELGMNYFDSCQLARNLWRGKLSSFSLKSLCQQIKFEFNHHNALEDARAAAYVIHALTMYSKTQTVEDLLKVGNVKQFYRL